MGTDGANFWVTRSSAAGVAVCVTTSSPILLAQVRWWSMERINNGLNKA